MATKLMNAGPVGLKPRGVYSASASYTLLDSVLYNHDSWVCTAVDADGNPATVTGQTPQAGSQYWQSITDGGLAAYSESVNAGEKAALADRAAANADNRGAYANEKGAYADNRGAYADNRGAYANEKGDYAKQQGDRAKAQADYPDEIREDGFVYRYGPTHAGAGADGYYKTDRSVVAHLDISSLTDEQVAELVDAMKADFVFASEDTCRAIISELT